jgi:2-isopropylmalate synthase
MDSSRRVAVFDTTLRDGEQSVGLAFRPEEKVELALALERLGVEVIEAGFPAASRGERDGVRAVAEAVQRPVVAAMARADARDIEAAAEALEPAGRSRVHIVLATSAIHRLRKLRRGRREVVELAARSIRYARPIFDEVEFCCEDASRTEAAFLREVCLAALAAGADLVNLPDTVGWAVPEEYAAIFGELSKIAPLSAHCHDDLGLAVANTVAAARAGAAQVECTINGLGERAGNAALEEVATVLALLGYETGIDLEQLPAVSELVGRTSGYPLPRHKPIVGENVLAAADG